MSDYPVSPHGWSSDLAGFREASPMYIRSQLQQFLRDASPEQVAAWDLSIEPLQGEVDEVIEARPSAAGYSAVLEYELPMEARRPDVVLLLSSAVLVLELKSKRVAALADVDQASAYARDLRAYHAACADRRVQAALVLMGARGYFGKTAGIPVIGADYVDQIVRSIDGDGGSPTVTRREFLDPAAYRPLPTIVEAARQLMESRTLVRIERADAATGPTLEYLSAIAHEAARSKTRHLVLLGGLPGTGKTLVGLQFAHLRLLDDLAVPRTDGKPTAPAVYLSGNGPLVEVLQHELRSAGGGGKAFVRGVKDYVARYSGTSAGTPEHVLIFDEAQRAFDARQVDAKHMTPIGKSEPELFVEFAERIPEWCVVVGLIGEGQEINTGEEGGISQWRDAIQNASSTWTVHIPEQFTAAMTGHDQTRVANELYLTVELRFHLAEHVHRFVGSMLRDRPDYEDLRRLAERLEAAGYPFRVTRSLEAAKDYLRRRYADDPDARYGIVASSRDKDLPRFGIANGFVETGRVRKGPWFVNGDDDPFGYSCRRLETCVTEFGCQGLELDGVLLGWGTDYVLEHGRWTNRYARRYQNPEAIKDALQLRQNAYRVLLTRARNGAVVFIPPIGVLDETFEMLRSVGFRELEGEDA